MLHELQQQFKRNILEKSDALTGLIQCEEASEAAERMDIYRNNTFVSLKNALLNIFPITAKLVSLEYFRYISDLYIQACPPQKGALVFYGQDFPMFMGNHASSKSFPFVEGVALLEWLQHESYGAKDEIYLKAEYILPEETTFKKASHVQLLKTSFKTLSLYNAVKNKKEIGDININQAEYVLVYRDINFDVQSMLVNKRVYDALVMIFNGNCLNDIADSLLKKYQNANALQSALELCFMLRLLKKKGF